MQLPKQQLTGGSSSESEANGANGSPVQPQRSDSVDSFAGSSIGSGSPNTTPPRGFRKGRPSPGSRARVLATLEEPPASPNSEKPLSDSAGSTDMKPLASMFPSDGNVPAPALGPPASRSTGAAASALADAFLGQPPSNGLPPAPPELSHVLSLLSRLLSASAVVVDLHEPPVAYIRCAATQALSNMESTVYLQSINDGLQLLDFSQGCADPGLRSILLFRRLLTLLCLCPLTVCGCCLTGKVTKRALEMRLKCAVPTAMQRCNCWGGAAARWAPWVPRRHHRHRPTPTCCSHRRALLHWDWELLYSFEVIAAVKADCSAR